MAARQQQICDLVKKVSPNVRNFPSIKALEAKLSEVTSHPEITPQSKITALVGTLPSLKIQIVLDIIDEHGTPDARLTRCATTLFGCEAVTDIKASVDAVIESAQLVLLQTFEASEMKLKDFKQLLLQNLHHKQGAESASSSMAIA
eukprot:15833730-Heterocapsa_arctica.AAC.1